MYRKLCALVLVFFLAFSVIVFAQEASTTAATKDQNAGTKLVRGVVNVLGCWIELPKQMYLTSKSDNVYIGLTYGLVKGIGEGVYRLAGGVFETVTCVLPPYDKIIVEPEYVFQGWEK